MAFGNMRGLGAWGVALAASLTLHVVVIGVMAVLGMRGCSDGDIPPLPPIPQTDGRAQDLPPTTDGDVGMASSGDSAPTVVDTEVEKNASSSAKPKQDAKKTVKPERPKREPRKAAVAKDDKSDSEPSKDGWRSYKVKPGDSLTKIARACGCTVQELAKANGLSATANLKLGQTIKVKNSPQDGE